MFPRNPNFTIEALSFWVGFIAASAFWLMLGWIRPLFKQTREGWQKKREETAMRGTSNIEEYHRQAVLKYAQGMHLAAPLFSLDEIVLPPSLIAPPPQVDPGDPLANQDQISYTVPYIPQDPELASFYQADTLTIPEALSGGSHLAIIGYPGVGKTVALAYIASLTAKRDPQMDTLQEAVPYFLHVADLDLPHKEKDNILDPLVDFVTKNASIFNAPRLPNLLRHSFNSGRALLIIDGLDETPQEKTQEIVAYLAELLNTYPEIRVIMAAAPEYRDQLGNLGFATLTLKTWNAPQKEAFLQKWGHLWENYVALETWVQAGPEQVDALLLNDWISIDSASLTPLELTLKTWGAYAGDGRGATALDAIETHLLRLSPSSVPIAALEMLAMQVNLTMSPIFDSRKARSWIKSFEPPEEKISDENEETGRKKKDKVAAPSVGLLAKIAQTGLLSTHRDIHMRFVHPVFGGYLAGRALSSYSVDERLTGQPLWSGKTLAMHYLAAKGDATPLTEALLEMPDPVLERNLLSMGNWLQDAPRKTAWHGKVLTALATVLQNDTLPLVLRGQIVTSLARSGDPSVAALFRQLLQTQSAYIMQLAALGSGLMQDKKAVEPLANLFQSANNTYTLTAACLALSAIGSDAALEAVAGALLHGDENLRRAAAESLSNHPSEGWEMLRDGLEMDDILVRRSVVYGLARVKEPWATELLAKVQVEDKEWAVRDIASSIIQKADAPNPRIPRKLSPPSETPWLIAFAGKQGMGISPGAPATDVLLLALKGEEIDERLATLPYLRRAPSEGVVNALYHAMNAGNIEMREAVFLTLLEIAASGVTLPNPLAYGLA
ncbi:MAG: NACHT domain-containing protein [Anaerolineae bacterium]|jgi:hypothetical protein|nr:NACHT domain-containing protein [Anaerolineae bacterium]MBT7326354.1 NACHT domain-containing protein [Anaerolineae bacterium]